MRDKNFWGGSNTGSVGIYQTPQPQAGYDTRSISKRGKTDLNQEFLSCQIKT